jgi:hypothetical protein
MNKFGVVGGSVPTKSGKFVVRVPKTLHKVLEVEAHQEGVSLNQLTLAKLSVSLQNATGLAANMIISAFNAMHNGHSPDWVIVHPECNARFLEQCREMGLTQTDAVLNHSLMNIRKAPKYKGRLNPTTKRAGFTGYDEFAFAAEIAVRALQRTHGITLDRMLCDPFYRDQFDKLALELVSDKTELQLRCAALNLRKTHKLKPIPAEVLAKEWSLTEALREVNLATLPAGPGGYALYDQNRPVFAGETANVKRRVSRHVAAIPEWMGVQCEELILKYIPLPAERDARLDWLGHFVNRERPVFNYQKVA